MWFEPVTSWLPVRCSTNWAMKPLTLGAGQLWVHMFPWKKWVLMIYEINHIWTAEMKWKWRNDRRSECNLCNCVKSRTISHVYSSSHNYFILLSSYSIFTISFVSLKIIMLPYYMHESYFCHKAKVPVLRGGVKKLFSWNSRWISYVANWYMYKHYSLVLYCFHSNRALYMIGKRSFVPPTLKEKEKW